MYSILGANPRSLLVPEAYARARLLQVQCPRMSEEACTFPLTKWCLSTHLVG